MGNKQRNGESYADYLLRRKAELTDEINKLDLILVDGIDDLMEGVENNA